MNSPERKVGLVCDGDVWNGYEWLRPERYEEQRLAGVLTPDGLPLPPIQGTEPPLPPRTGKGGPPGGGYAYSAPGVALPAPAPLPALVVALLQHLDPNPTRPGLLETPRRVAEAWAEWTSGYAKDPASILKVFEDGAEGCDEMVVVADIPVYSHCEHHLASIFGTCTVAYIPDGRIVGLSKLPRLVDIFSRRLQVQERLTNQVAEALMEHLKPRGCGVVVKARHMCMESRGINRPGTYTTTSALRGVFKEDPAVRAEFLSLAR